MNARAEAIEDGLLNQVGRWADVVTFRDLEDASAGFAADNAHLGRSGFALDEHPDFFERHADENGLAGDELHPGAASWFLRVWIDHDDMGGVDDEVVFGLVVLHLATGNTDESHRNCFETVEQGGAARAMV